MATRLTCIAPHALHNGLPCLFSIEKFDAHLHLFLLLQKAGSSRFIYTTAMGCLKVHAEQAAGRSKRPAVNSTVPRGHSKQDTQQDGQWGHC